MVQQLIKILIFLGISERWAVAITIAPVAAAVTWAGFGVYTSFQDFSQQINEIEQMNRMILEESQYIRNVNALLITYVCDLSESTERSTESMVQIIREMSKHPVNEPLVKVIEETMKENQQQLLPHHKVQRDSIKYVIGVRPMNSKK